jgi:hypothetical protein
MCQCSRMSLESVKTKPEGAPAGAGVPFANSKAIAFTPRQKGMDGNQWVVTIGGVPKS